MKINNLFLSISILCSTNAFSQYKYFNQRIQPDQFEEINIDSLKNIFSNPKTLGYTCSTDFLLGESIVDTGRYLFTIPAGMYVLEPRYMNELYEVCSSYGFTVEYEMVTVEAKPRRCLYEFMDLKLAQKYGADIKLRVHEIADSLFTSKSSQNYSTYWDCDQWPKLPTDSVRNSYIFNTAISDTVFKISTNWQEWPKVTIGIFLSAAGEVEKIVFEEYKPGLPENIALKNEAFQIAKTDFLNNYSKWLPCQIEGTAVKSYIMADYYLKSN